MKKRRMGRPPKAAGEAREYRMQVRLEETERQGFTDAARISGQELSVWVRDRLRRIAREELEHAGLDVPFSATSPRL